MAQEDHPSLPIVWFLDANDLQKRDLSNICYKLLVDAIIAWEDNPESKLQDLRDTLNEILEKKCP
ncbi:MAG: hypothetical protein KAI08_12855 [Bacteroidales bacterium]|nr:hypothetical protein [Bacteroidales bacterium]